MVSNGEQTQRREAPIRITGLRTIPLDVPSATGMIKDGTSSIACLVVSVDTDDGVTGETLLFAFEPSYLAIYDALLRALEPMIVGEDPTAPERLWERLHQKTVFLGAEGIAVFGRSAIDRACWDIAGKAAGLAVHRMVGAMRDRVPAYASGLWLSMSLDELARQAHEYVEQGFRAMKMRVGSPVMATDVERVRIVREAVGPDVALMVDANKRLDVGRAIRLAHALEPYQLTWFEEPLSVHDLEGAARIRAATGTPMAAGESVFARHGIARLIDAGAVDVVMPDLGRVGGFSEMLKVAHMAAIRNLVVSPHNYPHESLQVLGAIANGTFVECLPWFYPLYRESIVVHDGSVAIPQAPGLGCSFDPAAIERYRVDR
jgi:L-alanine-DL-glutamate epimerase-like enolase superfamily enzyme